MSQCAERSLQGPILDGVRKRTSETWRGRHPPKCGVQPTYHTCVASLDGHTCSMCYSPISKAVFKSELHITCLQVFLWRLDGDPVCSSCVTSHPGSIYFTFPSLFPSYTYHYIIHTSTLTTSPETHTNTHTHTWTDPWTHTHTIISYTP